MNEILRSDDAKKLMNEYGKGRIPFLFIIDFKMQRPMIFRLDDINPDEILFDIQGFSNAASVARVHSNVSLLKYPVSFEVYEQAFKMVSRELYNGNTYLLNLTFPTKIELSVDLAEIFLLCRAKFKLFIKGKFIVFSPEIFVRIEDGKISSYPMKGTIDASVPNAKERILLDEKEKAEHATIVDLIRNDLSIVAQNVKVDSYRYIDEIIANDKRLLQVSSQISGNLPADYNEHLGDVIFNLLPAGSICGAPKKKTVEIIKEIENYERGYFTGVFGCFDGKRVESGVMIRFIENVNGILYYKSGGGITSLSNAESEYKEMIDKVYVPIG
jgi:para-aminobenzoate synthetase component I